MVTLGISDDYAAMGTGEYDFYYGYEVETNDEWCFQVKQGNVEVCRYTTSYLLSKSKDLAKYSQDEPYMYLLLGIALFNEREI